MAYLVMAYTVMAYIVMAYIVMALYCYGASSCAVLDETALPKGMYS